LADIEFIPLGKPDITEKDIESVAEVLRSGQLVQGAKVSALESAFASRHKTNFGIAASNGTATLHLALRALGIGPGDEVIVPAFSYVATANVVELVGAKPIFVDVHLDTFNIQAHLIEKVVTSRTRAIIPVHEFGLACDIEQVCEVASRNELVVIEDAACALGALSNNVPVGSFGLVGSFSLHPRKSITAGEGGVLVTNDRVLSEKLQVLRNHGIKSGAAGQQFVDAGFNYRLTDMQAALALSQFSRFDTILLRKSALAAIYRSEISREDIVLPVVPDGKNHTWQSFHLLLPKNRKQQEVFNQLKRQQIGVNYGAQCIPALDFYRLKYRLNAPKEFPCAFKAYTKGMAIPLYERLTDDQAKYIAHCINKL